MLDTSIAREWAYTIVHLVADVENRVILEISRSVSADQGAAWWDTNKVAQLASLRARLLEQLGEPWEQVLDQAQKVLDLAADAGQGMARGDLRDYHETHAIGTLVTAQAAAGLAQIAGDTLKNMRQLPALIMRDAADSYQKIMTTPVTEVALGGVARRQATEDALTRFAARGIDSFTDKGGRRWRIDSYAEMATRTGALNAMRFGYTHTLTAAGLDLVQVVGHGYTCTKCAPWEGRILSLTGTTPVGRNQVQSVTGDKWISATVHGTYDQAIAEGLFHPNCEHSLAAYLPGASTPLENTGGDPESYKASQAQRALEREIRSEKRKLAAAITPQSATEHRRKIRAYQAQIRDLIAEHPKLKRKPEREANYKALGAKGATSTRAGTNTTPIKRRPWALTVSPLGIANVEDRFSLLKSEAVTRARRMEALKSDFSALKDSQGRWKRSQILEEHEVNFMERFERRGERVRWIPRDESNAHRSTNDFEWLTNGRLISELKCISGNYPTISANIRKSVKKAREHDVIKDAFIIDRGTFGLNSKLAHQLSLYNLRNPDFPIRHLFIMSNDGSQFIEIELQ